MSIAMIEASLTHSFFIIFAGAAILATIALYTKQPLIIAYIILGAITGPYGLSLVTDLELLSDTAHIGIIFLLFLLGLDMQPQSLLATLKKATFVALLSCLAFALLGFSIALAFAFNPIEAMVIGAACMFSSTIIALKLMPTTVLHHRHTGELMIGLLLVQDLLAIFILLILMSSANGQFLGDQILTAIISLPLLVSGCFLFVRYILIRLLSRFDRFHEYIFLLAIGWCLGIAEIAELCGLSAEIGAFIAGISLATCPISQYIAINLKPLRDFFLILFFFSLGAQFDTSLLPELAIPALVLAASILIVKPLIFRYLLYRMHEKRIFAWDIGFRLGQISEFSLLIAFIATENQIISSTASHLIQATAIVSFVVSSYIVVFNYPNPIAISDKLRRD